MKIKKIIAIKDMLISGIAGPDIKEIGNKKINAKEIFLKFFNMLFFG